MIYIWIELREFIKSRLYLKLCNRLGSKRGNRGYLEEMMVYMCK